METVNGQRVTRTELPCIDTDVDREQLRVYFSPDDGLMPAPSVTTVKSLRVDPDKADALAGWRQRYDGKSQYCRPWYKDQKYFKANRGTLIHFKILNGLTNVCDTEPLGTSDDDTVTASGNSYYHRVGDSAWGREEYEAAYRLKKWSDHAPSANTDAISFQPRGNKYDGVHAWDQTLTDIEWSLTAFKEECLDKRGLTDVTLRGLENFVYNQEHGYGGQYDLLYETPDGELILSDLKTSSAIRFDHKLQSAAYVLAVESTHDITIDATEIIRIDPDSEAVAVERSPDWDRTLDGLGHQFLGLLDKSQSAYQATLDDAATQLREKYKMTSDDTT